MFVWLRMFPRFVVLTTLLSNLVLSCDGGSGDPCQVETDCDDGLVCCGAARFGTPTRGVCAVSCADLREDAATMDATSDAIMSLPDGSADASPSDGEVDANMDAESPPVDSAVDAAPDAKVDASAGDAAVEAG